MKGWVCPRCDCVYAPSVTECVQCSGGHTSTSYTPYGRVSHGYTTCKRCDMTLVDGHHRRLISADGTTEKWQSFECTSNDWYL